MAGVEQYTYQLARRQLERHSVSVFCRESAPGRADYTVVDEEQAGLAVRRVVNNFRRHSNWESLYRNAHIEALFKAYLLETRPDIVHFQHGIGLSAGLPVVAAGMGIPHLATLHDFWYICPTLFLLTRDMVLCNGPHHGADCRQCLGTTVQVSNLLQKIPFYADVRDTLVPGDVQRRVLRWLQRTRLPAKTANGDIAEPFAQRMQFMRHILSGIPLLLTPSEFCRRTYLDYGLAPQKIRALPFGLELEPWRAMPPRRPLPTLRLGYIGTLDTHKGVDVLLRAFGQLPQANVELHFFGSDTLHNPVLSDLQGLAANDPRIHFHGRYENGQLPELLAGIDVVVLPTRAQETFSMVVREAMLAGAAVVASNVGAIPEAITHNVNGLLVPPGDETALAGALAQLAADPALVQRLAAAVKATPVKSAAQHAAEVEAVYREVLAMAAPKTAAGVGPAHE